MAELSKSSPYQITIPSKYDKVSFRQKGWEVKGNLIKGNMYSAYSKMHLGTIPCKIETILKPTKPNTKGFGKNQDRFEHGIDPLDVPPGPGYYNSKSGLYNYSFSKKGYGNGFISENKRFRISNYHQYQVPGPGLYSDRKNTVNKEIISSFREHATKPRIKKEAKSPGPADYDIEDRTSVSVNKSISIHSNSKRFADKAAAIPGPGNYQPYNDEIKRTIKESNSSANFKLAKNKGFSIEKLIYGNKSEALNDATPGPGRYEWPLSMENNSKNSKDILSLGLPRIKSDLHHFKIRKRNGMGFEKVIFISVDNK